MNFSNEFLDVYGLVLPQPRNSDKPCDNGVLFTSVAKCLGFDFPNYRFLIGQCFLKPGLLARWKGNDFDQAAWDDYMGLAVGCIKLGITDLPRQIIWYGIKHAFIFNTDNKLEGKDFLGRNVPIWPMMICAAFPFMKYLMFPFLWLVQLTFESADSLINRKYSSGHQLQWFYLYGCKELGFRFKALKDHEDTLKECFHMYYHQNHPFNTDQSWIDEVKK